MGGKAFHGVTQRIHKHDILDTLDWLKQNWPDHSLNCEPLENSLLGSAGKQDTSGDLDLNLDINAYDQAKVARDLTALLGEEFVKPRPGNNQIFTAIPIMGDAEKYGRVQVDFMFGNFKWQEFSYFSPAKAVGNKWAALKTGSNFKGLYRTEFIKALTAYRSDWVLEENGEMIARVGPTFFHDKGLVWRYRHRPMRKDGTARVKAFEELSKEEFLQIYPSAMTAMTDVMDDPQEVVKFILESHITPEQCFSLENLVLWTRRIYDSEAMAIITKIYLERLNSLKVEIPLKEFRALYLKV